MQRWFIAILPPSNISNEIISFQEELREQYGFSHALKTPPHLTIIPPFEASINQIDSFSTQLQDSHLPPFSLILDGFQAFHPRVIFVDVAQNQELRTFTKHVKSLFAAEKIVSNKGEKHSFIPHITIANRDLNNKHFKEIFPLFKTRPYNASFQVSSLYLLLKEKGSGSWKRFREIKF